MTVPTDIQTEVRCEACKKLLEAVTLSTPSPSWLPRRADPVPLVSRAFRPHYCLVTNVTLRSPRGTHLADLHQQTWNLCEDCLPAEVGNTIGALKELKPYEQKEKKTLDKHPGCGGQWVDDRPKYGPVTVPLGWRCEKCGLVTPSIDADWWRAEEWAQGSFAKTPGKGGSDAVMSDDAAMTTGGKPGGSAVEPTEQPNPLATLDHNTIAAIRQIVDEHVGERYMSTTLTIAVQPGVELEVTHIPQQCTLGLELPMKRNCVAMALMDAIRIDLAKRPPEQREARDAVLYPIHFHRTDGATLSTPVLHAREAR